MNVSKLKKEEYAKFASETKEVLKNRLDSEKLISKKIPNKNAISTMKMSRDDKYIVLGLVNGNIQMLDAQIFNVVHEFQYAHQDAVTALEITPDNRQIISGSRDRMTKIFDTKKKKEIKSYKENEGDISAICLSEDGTRFFTASYDRSVVFYNLHEMDKPLGAVMDVHRDDIECLIATKEGDILISGGKDQRINIIDIERREVESSFGIVHDSAVTSLALSSSGVYLVSGSVDRTINIYSMEKRELLGRIELVHEGSILSMAITADSRFLISGGGDGSVSFSDIENRERIHIFDGVHKDAITAISCSKTSQDFITASNDKSLNKWRVDQSYIFKSYPTYSGENSDEEITQMILHEKKNQIITSSTDRSIKIFNMITGELVESFDFAHRKRINTIALSNSGDILFSGSADKCINVYDMQKMYITSTIEDAHTGSIQAIAIAKDDSYFVSVGNDRAIKVYTGLIERSIAYTLTEAHAKTINKVCITEDLKYIVTAGYERHVKIWDKVRRTMVTTLKYFETKAELTALACTHNSKYIISASRGLNIYDMETLKITYQIKDFHKGDVNSISISDDNRYMTTCSADHTMRIFDIVNKETIHEFDEVHERYLCSLTTPDAQAAIGVTKPGIIYNFKNPIASEKLYVSDPTLSVKSNTFRYMIFNMFMEKEDDKLRIVRKYPRFIIYPYGYNWFHLACLFFQDKVLLSEVINSKVPFIRDASGKTPLHYLIELKDPSMINIVLSRFSEILNPEEDHFDLLQTFSDIFVPLIKMGVPGLKNFLDFFFVKPKVIEKEEVPLYVNIKGKKLKQIITDPKPLLRKDIYVRVLEKSQGDANIISIKCIATPLDYDPLSEDMHKIIDTLDGSDQADLLGTKVVENLIDYNWNNNKSFHVVLGVLITCYMIAFSVYATRQFAVFGLEIPLIVVVGIYALFEILKMIALGGIREYFSDIWNFADIGVILVHITTLIITLIWGRDQLLNQSANYVEEDVNGTIVLTPNPSASNKLLAISWLMAFSVFFGYIKWFSYFRVFDSTRRLSKQIIQICIDIRSFFLAWAMIVFGFSLVFMQFDIGGTLIGSWDSYLQIVYELTYSNFENSTANFDPGQLFFMVVLTILLSLILFNMLVAIMTDSFDKVQQNAVVSESQERIILIKQAISIKRLVRKACCRGRKKRKEKMSIEQKRSFLFVAEEAGVDEDAENENKEWEGRLQVIKKSIKSNEENMKIALNSFDIKVQKDLDELKDDSTNLEAGVRKLEGRLTRVEVILNRNIEQSDAASATMTFTEARSGPNSVADKKDLALRPMKKNLVDALTKVGDEGSQKNQGEDVAAAENEDNKKKGKKVNF